VRQHADKDAAQNNLGIVGNQVRQHADKDAAQNNSLGPALRCCSIRLMSNRPLDKMSLPPQITS
jgi:hypothetical protein